MKKDLNPDSRPIKHMTCHLNPRVKEKVKKEIDRMLGVGLIFLVDKSKWITHIIIQTNKGMEDI
jgi:hypothetical protein